MQAIQSPINKEHFLTYINLPSSYCKSQCTPERKPDDASNSPASHKYTNANISIKFKVWDSNPMLLHLPHEVYNGQDP